MVGTSLALLCPPYDIEHPEPAPIQLFISKRVDWIEPRRAPRWIERREERQRQRHHHNGGGLAKIDLRRQLRQKVEFWRKQFSIGEPRKKLPDRFDIQANQHADEKTGQ